MIANITFVFLFNFYFIIREVIKIIALYIKKYYKRISGYTDKIFNSENKIEPDKESNDAERRKNILN